MWFIDVITFSCSDIKGWVKRKHAASRYLLFISDYFYPFGLPLTSTFNLEKIRGLPLFPIYQWISDFNHSSGLPLTSTYSRLPHTFINCNLIPVFCYKLRMLLPRSIWKNGTPNGRTCNFSILDPVEAEFWNDVITKIIDSVILYLVLFEKSKKFILSFLYRFLYGAV